MSVVVDISAILAPEVNRRIAIVSARYQNWNQVVYRVSDKQPSLS